MPDITLSPTVDAEVQYDAAMRPRSFDEYVGQTHVKEALKIALDAAAMRKETIEHVLIYGAPGLGKTTLAHIIANHTGSPLRVTSGPAIERAGDLAAILTNLEPGSVLFIDECHRLPKTVEEILYPAMEDRALDLVIGKGPSARTLRIDLPAFTLVAATTRLSLLSSPLRDRFGHHFHIDHYTSEDIAEILRRNSAKLSISVSPDGLALIADRARGTPRVANRILKRVRDIAQVESTAQLDRPFVQAALERLHIDPIGLDDIDRKLLEALLRTFNGGPVGLQAWAAATAQEMSTIEEIYEPYLLQCGFVDRTARGRVATQKAYEHLRVPLPRGQEPLL
ncbi:MAG: Holliday junction DNA helicase RuvB [Deltaproteobacteria bacterium RIFCSPLOWO2_02_FULL_46_8]|nr:MAG: Holliday junction DNA helicase RuvB [Deltaproteobacteria bacterium RIFCSPLOWO2_02_FULL_46_8]